MREYLFWIYECAWLARHLLIHLSGGLLIKEYTQTNLIYIVVSYQRVWLLSIDSIEPLCYVLVLCYFHKNTWYRTSNCPVTLECFLISPVKDVLNFLLNVNKTSQPSTSDSDMNCSRPFNIYPVQEIPNVRTCQRKRYHRNWL